MDCSYMMWAWYFFFFFENYCLYKNAHISSWCATSDSEFLLPRTPLFWANWLQYLPQFLASTLFTNINRQVPYIYTYKLETVWGKILSNWDSNTFFPILIFHPTASLFVQDSKIKEIQLNKIIEYYKNTCTTFRVVK